MTVSNDADRNVELISQTVMKYIRAVQFLDFSLVKEAWIDEGHRWICDPETNSPIKQLSASHKNVIKSVQEHQKNVSEPQQEFSAIIQNVDYEGSAAMVKIAWHPVKNIDQIGEINYILLLKTDQGWKIVSKNAHRY